MVLQERKGAIRAQATVFAMMDWREDYLEKGGKPDRALAVSMWMTPQQDICKYEIWSRPDGNR